MTPFTCASPGDSAIPSTSRFGAAGNSPRRAVGVDVVAAGNDVLAAVARPAAHDIVVLPTSIDTSVYRATTASAADPPTIAWIGSPENLIYLEMIRPALARLAARHPTLTLRVICSQFPDWPEIHIERIAWSAQTEAGVARRGPHRGDAVDRRRLVPRQMRV